MLGLLLGVVVLVLLASLRLLMLSLLLGVVVLVLLILLAVLPRCRRDRVGTFLLQQPSRLATFFSRTSSLACRIFAEDEEVTEVDLLLVVSALELNLLLLLVGEFDTLGTVFFSLAGADDGLGTIFFSLAGADDGLGT